MDTRAFIYQLVLKETALCLNNRDFSKINTDALSISTDNHLDRANTSRILNAFFKENSVIKIGKRPIYFVARKILPKSEEEYPTFFENLEDFNEYIFERKIPNELISPFENMVGNKRNESLFPLIEYARTSLSYGESKNTVACLISGKNGTGKHIFFQEYYKLFLRTFCLSDDSFKKEVFHCTYNQISDLIKSISDSLNESKENLVIEINDIDYYRNRDKQALLSFIQRLINQPSEIDRNILVSIFSNVKNTKSLSDDYLYQYGISHFDLPVLNNRTLKEKFCMILQSFQNESNNSGKSIFLSKNVLNCFLLSTYERDIHTLNFEINQACKHSYSKMAKYNDLITIEFEDISDELLFKIQPFDTQQQKIIDQIYECINAVNIYFQPNKELKELIKLRETTIDEQGYLKSINDNKLTQISNKDNLVDNCFYVLKSYQDRKLNDHESLLFNSLFVDSDIASGSDSSLYKGLFFQILNQFNSNFLNKKPLRLEKMPANRKHNDHVSSLTKQIEELFSRELSTFEIQYISFYFEVLDRYNKNSFVSVIFVLSWKELMPIYEKYVTKLNPKSRIEFFSMSDSESQFQLEELINEIDKINHNRGVIVCCDEKMSWMAQRFLEKKCKSEIFLLSNINREKIKSIIHLINDKAYSLSEIKHKLIHDQSNYSIEDILNRILSDSLQFLNSERIVGLSLPILNKILLEFKIDYSDDIAVRFTSHLAFLIERSMTGEALPYKKMNNFIRKYSDFIQIIEKNMLPIESYYKISIKKSEYIYITEMFLELIKTE